jgi:hypothetical protein
MTKHEAILPLEAVEKIRSAAAERQANYRARKDRAKAKLKAESDAVNQTPDRFWEKNRSVANQTKIVALLDRQDYVLDLVQVISETIAGDVDLDQPFADLVAADVAEHGICETEAYLLEFWKDPDKFAMLCQRGDATSSLVRYGIVAGIPGHKLYEFQTWMKSKPATPQLLNFYVSPYTTLQCSCGSLPSAVSQSIADTYREKNIPYRCHECILKERASRAPVIPNVRREALPFGNFIE